MNTKVITPSINKVVTKNVSPIKSTEKIEFKPPVVVQPKTKRLELLGGTDKYIQVHTPADIKNITTKQGIKVNDPMFLFDSGEGEIEVSYKSKDKFDVYIDNIKANKLVVNKGEHILSLKGKGIISNLSIFQ